MTIQRVVELTFADEDISVVAFSDGERAIQSLSRTPPDIVLADIGMPGRSGYEVAQYIKQNPELSHIPVLLLTGAFEPVDHARVREVGCDGVLTKPFEPQLVISRVKELLTKSDGENGEAVASAGKKLDKAVEIENYFEQLDQAFATLASTPSAPASAAEPTKRPGKRSKSFRANTTQTKKTNYKTNPPRPSSSASSTPS
jgi:CheY-like chemotaxis protein